MGWRHHAAHSKTWWTRLKILNMMMHGVRRKVTQVLWFQSKYAPPQDCEITGTEKDAVLQKGECWRLRNTSNWLWQRMCMHGVTVKFTLLSSLCKSPWSMLLHRVVLFSLFTEVCPYVRVITCLWCSWIILQSLCTAYACCCTLITFDSLLSINKWLNVWWSIKK